MASIAPYVAEFLGTYILVLTVGCNVLAGRAEWGGVSIACSLMVMIYALASTSGANFNPAVSFALGLTKKMPWPEVWKYMGAQFLGGLVAGMSYMMVYWDSFNLQPTAGHTIVQAALAEVIYTFMLCFVVLNVAASKDKENQYFGLAIGFVIVAAAYSGGTISMGCFNPAVALGIDAPSLLKGFGYCLLYTGFEFLGAIFAALAFEAVRPDEVPDAFRVAPMGPNNDYPLVSKLISEFIGTFMLVLTVGLNVVSGSGATAFSIAACLMCMIFALGSVSGAHFNPAVTVAIICSGREKCRLVPEGISYIGVQLLAGLCAAFMYAFMTGGQTFALKPAASTWGQAVFGEFVYTFVLAFVVLSVATVKDQPGQGLLKQFLGFAIGMCVVVGGLAAGDLSGGSLNPAVSFGISSSHIIGGGAFWPCLVYIIVECAAGAAAAGTFYAIRQADEYDESAHAATAGGKSYGSA